MKKVIPQKVANKVFDKLLSENQNRVEGDWVETVLYKPGTNKIHNRFFKNGFAPFIYDEDRRYYRIRKSWISRQISNANREINDYLQER